MKVIFIFAHPDDETFSSGGTIAKLTKENILVKLITATKGEKGEVGNPPLCKKEELGKIREQELKSAAKILGISEIFFLGFIDGILENTSPKKLEKEVLKILESEKPDIVVTFDKSGISNHPDHRTISKIATSAFNKYKKLIEKHVKLYYTTIPKSYIKKYKKEGLINQSFGKITGTADKQITSVVDIKDTFAIKVKALKEHKTQHLDWERYLKRQKHVNLKKEFFVLICENSLV